jgi:DNA polymerase-3 subunit beta
LNREAFLAGLRRTSTILGERTVPTTMELKPGKLLLSCVNLDLGEARERLDVEYQHEEMTVGFNARYILDFLSVADGEQVTIHLQDALSPALFRAKDDKRYSCVIMPMRI